MSLLRDIWPLFFVMLVLVGVLAALEYGVHVEYTDCIAHGMQWANGACFR